MPKDIVLLSPNPRCPACGSYHTEPEKVSELGDMLAAGAAGAAALTLARVVLQGPLLPLSIVGFLLGVAAWATDDTEDDAAPLRKYQCHNCGCHFED